MFFYLNYMILLLIYNLLLLKHNQLIKIYKSSGNFNLYPNSVYKKIKVSDILEIGFEGLEAKVKKKRKMF